MTARTLIIAALGVTFWLLASEGSDEFRRGVIIAAGVLLLRFVAMPRLLGRAPSSRIARLLVASLVAMLLIGLILVYLEGLHQDVFLPLLVMAGVWLVLDQPETRVLDWLFAVLAVLVMIVGFATCRAEATATIAGAVVVAVAMLLAFARIDRQRVWERQPAKAPPAGRARDLPSVTIAVAVAGLLVWVASRIAEEHAREGTEGHRSSNGRIAGFADTVALGRFGLLKSNDAVALEVSIHEIRNGRKIHWREDEDGFGPELLMRGTTLDFFDGTTFLATRGDEVPDFPDDAPEIRRMVVEQQVRAAPHGDLELFAIPDAMEVREGAVLLDDRGGVQAPIPVTSRIAYTVVSRVIDPRSRAFLGRFEVSHPDPRYVALPDTVSPRVRDLAWGLTDRHPGSHSKVVAIRDFFQRPTEGNRFYYSLLDRNRPDAPIESFLFETREGHCEYFAAAMVVLLRSLELPARLAVGYRGGTYSDTINGYRVLQKDAHAWVEVAYRGVGWVPYDPTPAERMLDVDVRAPLEDEGRDPAQLNAEQRALAAEARRPTSLRWTLVGVLGLLIVAVGLRFMRGRASEPLPSVSGIPRSERSYHLRLLLQLRRFGAAPRPPATLRELLGEAQALPIAGRLAMEPVVALLYRARFGGVPPSDDERGELERALRTVEALPEEG